MITEMISTTGVNMAQVTYYVSKTYTQCGGTVGPGGSQCNNCGATLGTSGYCVGMIEVVTRQEAIEAQRARTSD